MPNNQVKTTSGDWSHRIPGPLIDTAVHDRPKRQSRAQRSGLEFCIEIKLPFILTSM